MSIESLKQQARKHEQSEEWQKALEQYKKALAELAREEQVDISLYNRVGDLYVRVGQLDDAVEHYEKAVELYREAYLPNNAIAVCKKIIRNVPARHSPYLMIGQIRAEQGFLPDARSNFLTYAERMQASGEVDEAFRALVEFCDLAPDDVEMRTSIADQMVAQGRTDDAVEQLQVAYQHYAHHGDRNRMEELESRILHLDPEANLHAEAGFAPSAGTDGEIVGHFGDIEIAGFGDASEEELSFGVDSGADAIEGAIEEASSDFDSGASDLGSFEISSGEAEGEAAGGLPLMDVESSFSASDTTEEADGLEDLLISPHDEAPEAEADPLPTLSFDDDEGDIGGELPMLEVESSDFASDPDALPTIAFGESDGGEANVDEEVADPDPLPVLEVDYGAEPPTLDEVVVADPSPIEGGLGAVVEASEDAVEEAFVEEPSLSEPMGPIVTEELPEPALPYVEEVVSAMHDAVEEAAADPPQPVEPEAEPHPAPEPEAPPAPTSSGFATDSDGFVDLGAMILGGEEKSTRFKVAYEEPTGDEEADFARMLSQFKDKVSENVDASDVRAHYDLGTAYKEMGLLDEAISSFQAALRASADHLPTYELMGQTFLEMGQPAAAVKSLQRALESANTVEDELVGIYYYMGRAHEALQNNGSALEFYDRVFSLDINFADVTDRLRELR